jgi:ankyrin repeat protein
VKHQRGCVIFLGATGVLVAAGAAVLLAGLYTLGRAFDGIGDDVCEGSNEPMQRQARVGDVDGLRASLDDGADANAVDRSGNTALGCALPRAQTAAAQLLLERGADANLPTGNGPYRELPLGLALRQPGDDSALALLAHGADPNGTLPGRGYPLTAALEGNHPLLVAPLLDRGADPNGRDDQPQPATCPPTSTIPAFATTDPCAPPPKVPLQAATNAAVVAQLLDHGADPNGRVGRRPLASAIDRSDGPSIDLLVSRGADPALPAVEGGRSIRDDGVATATAARRPEVVARLLDLGADPNGTAKGICVTAASTPTTVTPLCDRPLVAVAAAGRDDPSLVALLQHGADPNRVGDDRRSALSLAAEKCDGDAVHALVVAGARPTVDPVGQRPADVACPELRSAFGG